MSTERVENRKGRNRGRAGQGGQDRGAGGYGRRFGNMVQRGFDKSKRYVGYIGFCPRDHTFSLRYASLLQCIISMDVNMAAFLSAWVPSVIILVCLSTVRGSIEIGFDGPNVGQGANFATHIGGDERNDASYGKRVDGDAPFSDNPLCAIYHSKFRSVGDCTSGLHTFDEVGDCIVVHMSERCGKVVSFADYEATGCATDRWSSKSMLCTALHVPVTKDEDEFYAWRQSNCDRACEVYSITNMTMRIPQKWCNCDVTPMTVKARLDWISYNGIKAIWTAMYGDFEAMMAKRKKMIQESDRTIMASIDWNRAKDRSSYILIAIAFACFVMTDIANLYTKWILAAVFFGIGNWYIFSWWYLAVSIAFVLYDMQLKKPTQSDRIATTASVVYVSTLGLIYCMDSTGVRIGCMVVALVIVISALRKTLGVSKPDWSIVIHILMCLAITIKFTQQFYLEIHRNWYVKLVQWIFLGAIPMDISWDGVTLWSSAYVGSIDLLEAVQDAGIIVPPGLVFVAAGLRILLAFVTRIAVGSMSLRKVSSMRKRDRFWFSFLLYFGRVPPVPRFIQLGYEGEWQRAMVPGLILALTSFEMMFARELAFFHVFVIVLCSFYEDIGKRGLLQMFATYDVSLSDAFPSQGCISWDEYT